MSNHQSYQFGSPDQSQTINSALGNAGAAAVVSIRNAAGPQGYSSRTGEVTNLADADSSRVNMGHGGNGETGAILSTARSTDGARACPVSELTPQHRITVPGGGETTVAVAERMGIIHRNSHTGLYEESAAAPQAAEEAPQEAGEGFGDARMEESLSALIQGTDANSQVRALLDMSITGTVTATTLNALASQAGIHPEDMAQRLTAIQGSFRAQAASAVEATGIDAEEFFAWANTHKGPEMRAAMQRHGMTRSTGGYTELVAAYHNGLEAHDPQLILDTDFGRGITTTKVGKNVILNVPGLGSMSYAAAVKSGAIKFQMGPKR